MKQKHTNSRFSLNSHLVFTDNTVRRVPKFTEGMFETIKLTNVGPAPEIKMAFKPRLNILTGDNGLGKSFLLDIIWWCLTRTWPANVNPSLTAGKMALPHSDKKGEISFAFTGAKKSHAYTSVFEPGLQAWTGKAGRPAIPGLVIYAMSDGSLATWDPSRNYWRTKDGVDIQDRPPAYVLGPQEVWDGLRTKNNSVICNGLISDWVSWQKDTSHPYFANLKVLLRWLSPSDTEIMLPGEPDRISLDDVRDIPTLQMPYGQSVPIVHASSGMRRIAALSYFLLWTWYEHVVASKLLRVNPANQVIILIDEIESHLHPKWQRRIVPAVFSAMREIHKTAQVQLITATHSPLVMTSLEPKFDEEQDQWFDINLNDNKVELQACVFERYGDANSWLTSDGFDLSSTRAIETEQLLNEASYLLRQKEIKKEEALDMHQKLIRTLNEKDPFLVRWRYTCEMEGWLE